MLKRIVLAIVFLAISSPSLLYAESKNDKLDPKVVINNILNEDPFPHKKTSTRWTLDIDTENLFKDDNENTVLPDYLIAMIAVIGKYILWILLTILLFILYLNRKLFHFENILFSRRNKLSTEEPVVSRHKDNSTEDILKDVTNYIQNNDYRKAVALLYSGIITYLNKNYFIVPCSLTETEMLSEKNKIHNNNLEGLIKKVLEMRILIAFRNRNLDKKELEEVLMLWEKVIK